MFRNEESFQCLAAVPELKKAILPENGFAGLSKYQQYALQNLNYGCNFNKQGFAFECQKIDVPAREAEAGNIFIRRNSWARAQQSGVYLNNFIAANPMIKFPKDQETRSKEPRNNFVLVPGEKGCAKPNFNGEVLSNKLRNEIFADSDDADNVPYDVRSSLVVFYVPASWNLLDFRKLFAKYGNVLQYRLDMDPQTGLHKGRGFIQYDCPESAIIAANDVHGMLVDNNRRLKVQLKRFVPVRRKLQYMRNAMSGTISNPRVVNYSTSVDLENELMFSYLKRKFPNNVLGNVPSTNTRSKFLGPRSTPIHCPAENGLIEDAGTPYVFRSENNSFVSPSTREHTLQNEPETHSSLTYNPYASPLVPFFPSPDRRNPQEALVQIGENHPQYFPDKASVSYAVSANSCISRTASTPSADIDSSVSCPTPKASKDHYVSPACEIAQEKQPTEQQYLYAQIAQRNTIINKTNNESAEAPTELQILNCAGRGIQLGLQQFLSNQSPEKQPQSTSPMSYCLDNVPKVSEASNPLDGLSGVSAATVRGTKPSNKSIIIPENNLFIFHIPPDWTQHEFQRRFEEFGPIRCLRFPKDATTPWGHRGYGFICYHHYKDACRAIKEMDGKEVEMGRRLKVERKKVSAKAKRRMDRVNLPLFPAMRELNPQHREACQSNYYMNHLKLPTNYASTSEISGKQFEVPAEQIAIYNQIRKSSCSNVAEGQEEKAVDFNSQLFNTKVGYKFNAENSNTMIAPESMLSAGNLNQTMAASCLGYGMHDGKINQTETSEKNKEEYSKLGNKNNEKVIKLDNSNECQVPLKISSAQLTQRSSVVSKRESSLNYGLSDPRALYSYSGCYEKQKTASFVKSYYSSMNSSSSNEGESREEEEKENQEENNIREKFKLCKTNTDFSQRYLDHRISQLDSGSSFLDSAALAVTGYYIDSKKIQSLAFFSNDLDPVYDTSSEEMKRRNTARHLENMSDTTTKTTNINSDNSPTTWKRNGESGEEIENLCAREIELYPRKKTDISGQENTQSHLGTTDLDCDEDENNDDSSYGNFLLNSCMDYKRDSIYQKEYPSDINKLSSDSVSYTPGTMARVSFSSGQAPSVLSGSRNSIDSSNSNVLSLFQNKVKLGSASSAEVVKSFAATLPTTSIEQLLVAPHQQLKPTGTPAKSCDTLSVHQNKEGNGTKFSGL